MGCSEQMINEKEDTKEQKNILGVGNYVPNYLDAVDEKYIAYKATNKSEHDKYWNDFKIKGDNKDIDFDIYDTYFLVTFGSSSCPSEIKNVSTKKDTLHLDLDSKTGDCTDDLSITSYVLKMSKTISNSITKVSFDLHEENKVLTKLRK